MLSEWILKFEKNGYYVGYTKEGIKIGLKGIGAIEYKEWHKEYNIINRLRLNQIEAHFDMIWNN